MTKRSNWSLIGIPDHDGVIHVGGRVGAAGGPRVFRDMLARFKGRDGVLEARVDRGDVSREHREAAEAIAEAHAASGLSIVVGGAHDHGYSHLLGLRHALAARGSKRARLGCINIDAHLDVRPPLPPSAHGGVTRITSGSPFFLALEEGVIAPSDFVEFGIQAQCNASDLWDYVERKKVKVVDFEKLRGGRAVSAFRAALKTLCTRCDLVAVSFDLDACAEAFAPGVSAPQAEGFGPGEISEMMAAAGAMPKVASLGIFELNPEHDIGGRTARLAATAAYHYAAAALGRG